MPLLPLMLLACGGHQIDQSYVQNPVITRVVPSSGPSLGGTTVSIEGRALCDNPTVAFGGLAARSVQSASEGVIVAVTPPHVVGEAPLEVRCNQVAVPDNHVFQYYASDIRFETELTVSAEVLSGGPTILFGDLNSDGKDDLFAFFPQPSIPGTDATLKVYLNDGRRGFDMEPFLVKTWPNEVFSYHHQRLPLKLGDFDGDGKPDLLVCTVKTPLPNSSDEKTTIVGHLYASSQAFAEAATIELAGFAFTTQILAVLDLNGDGRLDLIVADGDTVYLQAGQGKASFAARVPLANFHHKPMTYFPFGPRFSNGSPAGMPPFDPNGDGLEDLLLMDYDGATLDIDWRAVLASSNGDPQVVTFSSTKGAMLFYHDKDGLPDLYRVDPPTAERPTRQLQVWPALALGVFSEAPVTYQIPCTATGCDGTWPNMPFLFPYRFDVNQDSSPEVLLVIAHGSPWPQNLEVARSLEWVELGPAPTVRALLAADEKAQAFYGLAQIDGAGSPELVYHSNKLRALYFEHSPTKLGGGDVKPDILMVPYRPAARGEGGFCGAGDFTGDGRSDLLLMKDASCDGKRCTRFRIIAGDGQGGFAAGEVFDAEGFLGIACATGRYGSAELGVRTDGAVFARDAKAVFRKLDLPVPLNTITDQIVAQLDINADGIDDFIVCHRATPSALAADLRVVQSGAGGSYSWVATVPVVRDPQSSAEPWLALGDFNGDKLLDLLTAEKQADGSPALQLLMGRGIAADRRLTLERAQSITTAQIPELTERTQVTAKDLDGDGDFDLLLATDSQEATLLFYVLMNTRGELKVVSRLSAATQGALRAICDLNGNGKQDLLFSRAYALQNASDLSYGSIQPLDLDLPGKLDGCFDITGDSLPDLVTTTGLSEFVYVVRNISR